MSSFLAFSQAETEVAGLIIPRDNNGMYIRNKEAQFGVTWTSKTKVALVVNTRLLSGIKGGRLAYKIHSSGAPADALGQFLGKYVKNLMKKK